MARRPRGDCRHRCWLVGFAPTLVAAAVSTGCQSLSGQSLPSPSQPTPDATAGVIRQASAESDSGSSLVPADSTPTDAETPAGLLATARQVAGRVAGQPANDQARAKELYREADAMFRRAQSLDAEEAEDLFADAGKNFDKAAKTAPGTALGQDALFMQAESEFFSHQLDDAAETYQKLQKDYPRNRHSDLAASRLFNISRYWIEHERADGSWLPNLTDEKRPLLDSDGHAIRILDQIRFDDPTGRLADDATMAAAAEHLLQQRFLEADQFLTDLRETYPDSQHLFLAHMLGIQCKLKMYAGPKYSNLLLDEAKKLVEQTRRRFPDRLQEKKYAEVLAHAAAEIDYHKANKLLVRGRWNEKQRNYRAAGIYYRKIRDEHPNSQFAEIAEQRLKEISDLPPVPRSPLRFLKSVFRDPNQKPPLELIVAERAPSESSTAGEENTRR